MSHILNGLLVFLYIFLFFIAPLSYQLFFSLSNNLLLSGVILYVFFVLGYYILYNLLYVYKDKRGNYIIIGDNSFIPFLSIFKSKNKNEKTPYIENEQTILERGIIEQNVENLIGIKHDIRILIFKRALLFGLILLLTLLPLIYLFEDSIRYQQIVNNDENSFAISSIAQLLKLRIQNDTPDDIKFLNDIKRDDIIVVRGKYDRVEIILALANIPFTLISNYDLSNNIKLHPKQILIINCPGVIPTDSFNKIENFVANGGYLFTTDWAIVNVLEKVFTGYLKPYLHRTPDTVIPISKVTDSVLLNNVFLPNSAPSWWVFSSYPYEIINNNVILLVRSEKLKHAYNKDAVACEFKYKKGKIIHVAAHFYQHRSLIKTLRQKRNGLEFVKNDLLIDISKLDEKFIEKLKNLKAGQLEDIYSIIRFITNVIIDRKKTQTFN